MVQRLPRPSDRLVGWLVVRLAEATRLDGRAVVRGAVAVRLTGLAARCAVAVRPTDLPARWAGVALRAVARLVGAGWELARFATDVRLARRAQQHQVPGTRCQIVAAADQLERVALVPLVGLSRRPSSCGGGTPQ